MNAKSAYDVMMLASNRGLRANGCSLTLVMCNATREQLTVAPAQCQLKSFEDDDMTVLRGKLVPSCQSQTILSWSIIFGENSILPPHSKALELFLVSKRELFPLGAWRLIGVTADIYLELRVS